MLEMINAMVSHELRNPLNSMIGQICSMEEAFEHFQQLMAVLASASTSSSELADLYKGFQKVFASLSKCGKKLTSASKFIDFFVHDILDYTILNKRDTNFLKEWTTFDVREAIQQIMEIQEDKAEMKTIKVKAYYVGFELGYWINTDLKRLQQILLNLYSNALKFTDREGSIIILVENVHIKNDRASTYLRVSVVDSGLGIKEKDKHKIF